MASAQKASGGACLPSQASDEESEIAPILKYVVNTVSFRIMVLVAQQQKKITLLLSVRFCI